MLGEGAPAEALAGSTKRCKDQEPAHRPTLVRRSAGVNGSIGGERLVGGAVPFSRLKPTSSRADLKLNAALGHELQGWAPLLELLVARVVTEAVVHLAAITANLASLAHALGVIAIAEGIESESQLAAVQELGCDHAQGFLFAYPMPAGDLGRLLSGDGETFAESA